MADPFFAVAEPLLVAPARHRARCGRDVLPVVSLFFAIAFGLTVLLTPAWVPAREGAVLVTAQQPALALAAWSQMQRPNALQPARQATRPLRDPWQYRLQGTQHTQPRVMPQGLNAASAEHSVSARAASSVVDDGVAVQPLPPWVERGMADLFPLGSKGDPDQYLAARLEQARKENRPLRVKLGIDPTGSDIHLGHSILFRKLRAFQDAGHTAVLIIGDFTARIGDPTGKSSTRVQLTAEQVEANANTYLSQLGQGQPRDRALLDFETSGRLEVRRNSEWLANLDLPEVIGLLGTATVGQMLAKEDFGNRYGSGTPIALHEFLYPLLQGYDSVAVKADVELGGTDQKFNVAMGRDLQKHFDQKPQFGMLMPILAGLDGQQKMSKSLGNTIGLEEDPLSMYSKLEKVPDALVDDYLTLLTDLDLNGLPPDPRERQKSMAKAVTASRHGQAAAETAQSSAATLVGGASGAAQDIPEASLADFEFPTKAFFVLSKLGICKSSSDARRQIQGGAVRLDGEKITDPNQEFADASELSGKVLQLGKKTFRRLTA